MLSLLCKNFLIMSVSYLLGIFVYIFVMSEELSMRLNELCMLNALDSYIMFLVSH